MNNVLIPTTLILTAALGLAGATRVAPQTLGAGDENANVTVLDATGRPGAVDVYVDGARVGQRMRAGDRPLRLHVQTGPRRIMVKSSLDGSVLTSTQVNVRADHPYAVTFRNSGDAYTLELASGDRGVRRALASN